VQGTLNAHEKKIIKFKGRVVSFLFDLLRKYRKPFSLESIIIREYKEFPILITSKGICDKLKYLYEMKD
jgi:hypothetical protein